MPTGIRLKPCTTIFFGMAHFALEFLEIFYHPRIEVGIVFSRVRVCVCLCVDVCQHHNSWTARDFITKFSGRHPMVKRADSFENGNCAVRRWWKNVSDILVRRDIFTFVACLSVMPQDLSVLLFPIPVPHVQYSRSDTCHFGHFSRSCYLYDYLLT